MRRLCRRRWRRRLHRRCQSCRRRCRFLAREEEERQRCWGSENRMGSPNIRVRNKCTKVMKRGDRESPKACTRLKSCESLYTCPRAPFYRETKGLLHFEITLKSREYS
jgi:hypothetical protein